MNVPGANPLVVQYLYVHEPDEGFSYPTARAGGAAAVAERYLECAVTQFATLAYRDVECEPVLVINVADPARLGRRGAALLAKCEELGARIVATPYTHRPKPGTEEYVSSRYLLDAILSCTEGLAPARELWLTDLDCVWADPASTFAAAPPEGQVGCVFIEYPPDWDPVGFEEVGRTRNAIGELATSMGHPAQAPPWIGGELICGTAATLLELVAACEQLDAELDAEGRTLPTEEQILTLAGAVGRVSFTDLSAVARRITTGPRSHAPRVSGTRDIGLWHLPSEKGLSMRRTAQELLRGRTRRLARDLADPDRTARRFNVARTGPLRRLRDDGWIASQRLRRLVSARA
ncbi:MAG TPA: hypothetical protein VNV44_06315 [Solirubrobacteraceae bacterium]|jgi:hypothetical protein|nr:hypothetical protein [Solirubrobacteraceae bacterium]